MNLEYTGIIIDTVDPKKLGRYKVSIPELFISTDDKVGVWCQNRIGDYQLYKQGKKIKSQGSYKPLKKDMMVSVKFTDSSFIHGEIVKHTHKDKTPTIASNRDHYHQLLKTEDGAFCYYDEKKRILHSIVDNGSTSVMQSQDKVVIYAGETINEGSGGVKPKKTTITAKSSGCTIANDKSFIELDHNVIELRVSDKAYLKLSKDGIEMYAKEKINIHGQEEVNVYSGRLVRIHGENEMHVLSNETRVTGYQACAVSSNFLKLTGAHHIYQKSDNIELDAASFANIKSPDTKISGNKFYVDTKVTAVTSKGIGLNGTVAISKPLLTEGAAPYVIKGGSAACTPIEKTCSISAKVKEKMCDAKDMSALQLKNKHAAKSGCAKSDCNPAEEARKCDKPERALPTNAHDNTSTCVQTVCSIDIQHRNEKKFNCEENK